MRCFSFLILVLLALCFNERTYSQVADSVRAPELKKFLEKNIRYPPAAQESGTAGKVSVSFKINQDRSITDIVIIKSVPYGCDDEVLRVLKKFKGTLDLKPDEYTFSIVFDSDESEGYNAYAWKDRKYLKNFLFGTFVLYRPIVIKRVTVN